MHLPRKPNARDATSCLRDGPVDCLSGGGEPVPGICLGPSRLWCLNGVRHRCLRDYRTGVVDDGRLDRTGAGIDPKPSGIRHGTTISASPPKAGPAVAGQEACDTSPVTVVVVGSANLDLVVGLQRMPAPGETVFGHSLERFAGGKGLNQAVAAARAGARVAMVGAVGSDDAGSWLRGLMVDEGIDAANVRSAPGPSGTALIEVDESGMNRIVVIPGANAAVDADHVEQALRSLDQVTVVLAQHEVPPDAVGAAMRAGRLRGALTILNPAPARELDPMILADVDLLVPNEHEAALLTGMPVGTADEARACAASLRRLGATAVVITRGDQGVAWADADGTSAMGAFEVEAVDTVAAGDAFCGGLATALSEGAGLVDALRLGSAAGALAAGASGAVPSLPTRASIEAFAQRA